jgi:hypothetical protein
MISDNNNFILVSLFSIAFLMSTTSSQANEQQNEFISGFILGKYQLIGKSLDSEDTYFGGITISQDKENITFVKTTEDKTIHGSVAIETTDADKEKVIRLWFEAEEVNYEETCLISADLDNYARLTCHYYQKDVPTDSPGLEAMFITN